MRSPATTTTTTITTITITITMAAAAAIIAIIILPLPVMLSWRRRRRRRDTGRKVEEGLPCLSRLPGRRPPHLPTTPRLLRRPLNHFIPRRVIIPTTLSTAIHSFRYKSRRRRRCSIEKWAATRHFPGRNIRGKLPINPEKRNRRPGLPMRRGQCTVVELRTLIMAHTMTTIITTTANIRKIKAIIRCKETTMRPLERVTSSTQKIPHPRHRRPRNQPRPTTTTNENS